MKYETHLDREIPSEGMTLQGEICCDYDTLVKFFGQPLEGNGVTSLTAEWHVAINNRGKEVFVHIYDSNTPKIGENQRFWDIAGHSRSALKYIMDILGDELDSVWCDAWKEKEFTEEDFEYDD